jgi:hypothetical protein
MSSLELEAKKPQSHVDLVEQRSSVSLGEIKRLTIEPYTRPLDQNNKKYTDNNLTPYNSVF